MSNWTWVNIKIKGKGVPLLKDMHLAEHYLYTCTPQDIDRLYTLFRHNSAMLESVLREVVGKINVPQGSEGSLPVRVGWMHNSPCFFIELKDNLRELRGSVEDVFIWTKSFCSLFEPGTIVGAKVETEQVAESTGVPVCRRWVFTDKKGWEEKKAKGQEDDI